MQSTVARRRRRERTTAEYVAFATRIVAQAGERVAEADVEDLHALVSLRAVIDEAILEAVRGLRDTGVTWEEIGRTTGTTRQAALMKWGPKL